MPLLYLAAGSPFNEDTRPLLRQWVRLSARGRSSPQEFLGAGFFDTNNCCLLV